MTAATAFWPFVRRRNDYSVAIHVGVVQGFDGRRSVSYRVHLNECGTARLSGLAVGDNPSILDVAEGGKELT